MKANYLKKLFLLCCLTVMTAATVTASSANNETTKDNDEAVKVLVIALPNNVQSNYFPNSMITEETGIPTDSIDYTYNQVVVRNIIDSNKDRKYQFVSAQTTPVVSALLDEVKLQGEEEEIYVDLSHVNKSCYKQLINDTASDYILFLSQHYLKWQEKPLHTLFHITCYSLYDKNQKEVTHGNNFFTSMNLENKEKLSRDSKKSSSKIASNIVKRLEK